MQTQKETGASPYRFIVLLVYMLLTMAIQVQWLTHAAVVRPAEVFYQGQFNPNSIFNMDFLALSYMLVFLLMSFPASYVIDTYGIRKGLVFGASLTIFFSVLKAVWAQNFTGVLVAQLGLAFAQPFIINAVTAVSVRWFAPEKRALAAGLATLAQYVGIIAAMLLTPKLVVSDPSQANYGAGFVSMLWIYAIFSVLASLLLIVFLKEKPASSVYDAEERFAFTQGLKHILTQRDMLITLFLFLIGLGILNAVSSMTDSIAEYLGVHDSDGLIGGIMLVGGILGSLLLPALSDKFRKRKLFLVLCMFGMIPGVAGMAFAQQLGSSPHGIYSIALWASFVLGFFVMSAGPIGFQYAAEVSHPAPESTSQGMLLWIGQVSGIVFVTVMSLQDHHFLKPMMMVFSLLALLAFVLVLFVKESEIKVNA